MRLSVYGLVDPKRPKHFRYVGLTSQALKKRLKQHVHNRRDLAANPPQAAWILGLLAKGRQPRVVLILRVAAKHGHEAARDIRRRLLAAGHKLTNLPANPTPPKRRRLNPHKYRAETRQRNIEWRNRVRADPVKHALYLEKATARKHRIRSSLQSGVDIL